jgi:hypothetical protein
MTEVLVSLPWAVLCGGLLYALTRVLEHARVERAELLQRIQAPEVAVAQHVQQTDSGPEGLGWVPPHDDELARQNYMELMGVSAE